MAGTATRASGPKLGPETVRLKARRGHLYAVSYAVEMANPVIVASWYKLEETVKLFTDAGIDITGDIDEPLEYQTLTHAYKGTKYYYHLVTEGVAEDTERTEVKRPIMPPNVTVKWHNGAWCKLAGGRYEPIEKARVAL